MRKKQSNKKLRPKHLKKQLSLRQLTIKLKLSKRQSRPELPRSKPSRLERTRRTSHHQMRLLLPFIRKSLMKLKLERLKMMNF
jgi:hypothetical protein